MQWTGPKSLNLNIGTNFINLNKTKLTKCKRQKLDMLLIALSKPNNEQFRKDINWKFKKI